MLGDVRTRQIALFALTEATRNTGEHQKVLDYFDQLRAISPTIHVAERIRAFAFVDDVRYGRDCVSILHNNMRRLDLPIVTVA